METIKIKYITFILLAVAFSISSCKKGDWYDVKSDKALSVPTTLKDLQALMDNSKVMNRVTPSMGEAASDGHYLMNEYIPYLTALDINPYTWSHTQRYEGVPDWMNGNADGSYKRVYFANLVLDGLTKIKPINNPEQEQWNSIKGQALFHRAHAFYELAQIFSPPYEAINASNKLGIPLRLESDINIPSKRSSLKQTYDRIIDDLNQAKDLLLKTSLYKTRPCKPAVFALLARVYLSMGDYSQAGINAGLCLNDYNTLMDYNTLDKLTIDNPIIGYNPEVIFYSRMTEMLSVDFSINLIEKSWYDAYENNDLRKIIFFNQDVTSKLITYKGTYSGRGFNGCFSGMATDEVYLIRAESFARTGLVVEAMKDLNTLLRKRWSGTYTDLTVANAEDVLKKVLEERNKELIMRGLRWSDLRRLNRDPKFAVTLTRTVQGKTYTLEPNSYKYTFPIPDDIIEMTGMEQNEGWK